MLHIVHTIFGVENNDALKVMMIMVIDIFKLLLNAWLNFLFTFFVSVIKAKPLGCMSDALASASASFEVLQKQLSDCTNNVEQLQRNVASNKPIDAVTLSASVASLMVRDIEMSYLVNFCLNLFCFCTCFFFST